MCGVGAVWVMARCAMIFPLNRVGVCVHKSGQASTREPADSDLQDVFFLDPALVKW